MRRFFRTAALMAISLISGCSFSLAGDVTPPPGYQQPITTVEIERTAGPVYPLLPPDPSSGKEIYLEKCADCHGLGGLGDGARASELPNPVAPIGDFDTAREAVPSQWFKIITQGDLDRFMPPFFDLTDRQRWDTLAYVLTLSGSLQPSTLAEDIYSRSCANCHGMRGKGDGPDSGGRPMPDFTRLDFGASRSLADLFQSISACIDAEMHASHLSLSKDERWALTVFLRSLSFNVPIATEMGRSVQPSPPSAIVKVLTVPTPQASGVVKGAIVNASGGLIPIGEQITLHAFDQMQLVYTATTQIQSNGTYAFKDVQMPPGRGFISTVDLNGVVYRSELMAADGTSSEILLPVQVYDSISDPSILIMDRLHLFIELLNRETVRIVELYIISNPTKKILVAPEPGKPVVSFSLPDQAHDIKFEGGELGERFQAEENGFGDTDPVKPGDGVYQLMVTYLMPYDRKLLLVRNLNMDVKAVVILVPEDGIHLKGEGIVDSGSREVQGVRYHMYNGGRIPKTGALNLLITGRPAGNSAIMAEGSKTNTVLGLGVFCAALVLAGLWIFRRNRREVLPARPEKSIYEDRHESAESVMDAILALDDLYQEGRLPKEAYLQRRGELKERLSVLAAKNK